MGEWLGQELRRIRQSRGLSLRQLAARCGLPHMTYTTYEIGKAAPPPAKRPALAEALGITAQALDDLIEDDAYEVFLRARPLSEEGRNAAREFLRKVREDDRKKAAAPAAGRGRRAGV